MVLSVQGRYAGAVGSGSVMQSDASDPGRRSSKPRQVKEASRMGSVVKKRRKRMAKKKHRKLLRKTRVQRRRLGK